MDLKTIVKGNTARFVRYRQGNAYYAVNVPGRGEFTFPVMLADLDDATLEYEEKAIMLMRYIRRALDEGTFLPTDTNA